MSDYSITEFDSIVTDTDGNSYTSVKIGSQEWMVENLRTTKYADGNTIPNVKDRAKWSNLKIGAWCHYDNDSLHNDTYGKLYNWNAIETGKLCPTGWHVPTDIAVSYTHLTLPTKRIV